MEVRDGQSNIDAVGEFLGLGRGAAERLCGERRVELAIEDGEPVGAVAYDVREGAVHVTRLAGTQEAQVRLLESPLRFAASEGLPAESVVPESESETRRALRAAGFEEKGAGPRFEGKHTVEYRHDDAAES